MTPVACQRKGPAAKKSKPAGGVLGAVASAPKAVAQTATSGTLPFTGLPLADRRADRRRPARHGTRAPAFGGLELTRQMGQATGRPQRAAPFRLQSDARRLASWKAATATSAIRTRP